MFTYVMTLQCTDRPGIVRATSTAIVEVDGNILENDQFTDPVTNQFCMRTRFETEKGDIDAVRDLLNTELANFSPHLRSATSKWNVGRSLWFHNSTTASRTCSTDASRATCP